VRTSRGNSSDLLVEKELHRGSVFSPFLSVAVMDEVTTKIQDKVPWFIIFVDDIILIDEPRDGYIL